MRLTANSLFDVTYDGSSVVTLRATAETVMRGKQAVTDEASWLSLLDEGQRMRAYFKQTRPGSDWGCDGVGYDVQKRLGEVLLHRSGVGPTAFRTACREYMQEVLGVRIAPEPEVQTSRPRQAREAVVKGKRVVTIIKPQGTGYRTGQRAEGGDQC